MSQNIKLSKHAIERLVERYQLIPTKPLLRIMGDSKKYMTLQLNNNGDIRQIQYGGKYIQYVVKNNTVLSFIPPTTKQNKGAKKYQEIIRKEEIINAEYLRGGKAITKLLNKEKSMQEQLRNQKIKIKHLKAFNKNIHDQQIDYHYDRPLLKGIAHYVSFRRKYFEIKKQKNKLLITGELK